MNKAKGLCTFVVLRVDVEPLLDERDDAALVPLARGVVQWGVVLRVPLRPPRARLALCKAVLGSLLHPGRSDSEEARQ
eukprot:2379458-Pyramimonas_sp.AAC.1